LTAACEEYNGVAADLDGLRPAMRNRDDGG
jgi:hypothetical protein